MPENEEQMQVTYMPDRESPSRSNGRIFDFGAKGRIELVPGINSFKAASLTLLATDPDFQTMAKQGAIIFPEGYTLPEADQAKQDTENMETPIVETSSDAVPLPAPIDTPIAVNIDSGEILTVDPEIQAKNQGSSFTLDEEEEEE